MSQAHPLDAIKDQLVQSIKDQRQILHDALVPADTRPPFTSQLSKPEALDWWTKHRYDNYGQSVLQNMSAQSILELDQALSQKNEQSMFGMGGQNVTISQG